VVRITTAAPSSTIAIIDLSLAAAREVDSIAQALCPCAWKFSARRSNRGFFTGASRRFPRPHQRRRLRDRLSATYSPIFIQQYDSPDGCFIACASANLGEDPRTNSASSSRPEGLLRL